MNRAIFRGKRVITGEWEYGYYYRAKFKISDRTLCDYISTPRPAKRNKGSDVFMVQPKTIGQFTGFYDKNKKEIYEDDIIQYYEKKLLITMSVLLGIKLKILNKPFNNTFEYDNGDILYESGKIEIIGNTHDNPELINEI